MQPMDLGKFQDSQVKAAQEAGKMRAVSPSPSKSPLMAALGGRAETDPIYRVKPLL